MATLTGTSGYNTLVGTASNDTLIGGGGNDTLQGRQGIDTAKFSGALNRYTIGTQRENLYILDSTNTDGRDLLTSIEKLGFADTTLTVSQYQFSIPHTSAALQTESSITTLTNGNYVVTWTASTDWNEHGDLGIFAQRFNASGKALGSVITISDSSGRYLAESTVAALADGGFVVCWKDRGAELGVGNATVYAKAYTASGTVEGTRITVSGDDANSYSQMQDYVAPKVTTFDNGDFLVTSVTVSLDIYGQRYDSHGAALGSSFRINDSTSGTHFGHSIDTLLNGNTVSAWIVNPDDTNLPEILRLQIRNGASPVGSAIDIENAHPIECSVSSLGTGGFVVTWRSLIYNEATDTQTFPVYFQRYDASGNALGAKTQVHSNSPPNGDMTTTELQNGGFVIVCDDAWARMYTANGSMIGSEIDFSTQSGGGEPSITARIGGGFTVCWTSNYEDGPLLYQSYDGDGNYLGRKISGTAKGETIKAGDAAMLAIDGGGGNDTLYGGTGATTLIGGAGDDILVSGKGNDHFIGSSHGLLGSEIGDVVSYARATSGVTVNMSLSNAQSVGGGMGVDTIDSTVESLLGSNYGDVLRGNGFENNIKGGGGNDRVWGGSSGDFLSGGSGNDTLHGDAGSDRLYADAGKDVLIGGSGGDVFLLRLANSGPTDRDTIQDFSRAQGDKIALQRIPSAKFDDSNIAENFRSGSAVKALDANDFVLYNTATGILSYDPDGSGSKAAIALAVIGTTTHPALNASDLYVLW